MGSANCGLWLAWNVKEYKPSYAGIFQPSSVDPGSQKKQYDQNIFDFGSITEILTVQNLSVFLYCGNCSLFVFSNMHFA